MKKRLPSVLLCLALLLSVPTGCASGGRRVMDCWEKHHAALAENIARHSETGEPLAAPRGVTVREWSGEHVIVEYTVTAFGIAPASAYRGFFWSQDDVPVSFQNAGTDLVQSGEAEWRWSAEGDDHGLVRRIAPGWFYFEAYL